MTTYPSMDRLQSGWSRPRAPGLHSHALSLRVLPLLLPVSSGHRTPRIRPRWHISPRGDYFCVAILAMVATTTSRLTQGPHWPGVNSLDYPDISRRTPYSGIIAARVPRYILLLNISGNLGMEPAHWSAGFLTAAGGGLYFQGPESTPNLPSSHLMPRA
jgi:hypothetical protein